MRPSGGYSQQGRQIGRIERMEHEDQRPQFRRAAQRAIDR